MYENLPPTEIYRKIENIHGESTIRVQHPRKWYEKYESSCENIVDESCSGRLISVADKTFENKVDTIIRYDQKARLSNIAY